MKRIPLTVLALALAGAACHKEKPYTPAPLAPGALATGEAALGDWTTDAPGVRRKITPADMPAPYATKSVRNRPHQVERPNGALPKVPAGFKVELFASGLENPRMIRTAPNGDVFVAESEKNQVRVFRGGAPKAEVFATDLKQPFGIAFYPPNDPKFVYVANTDSIVRFPYAGGSGAKPEEIYGKVSGGGHLTGGGHWTRDLAFSRDGTKLYLSVGSKSNVDEDADPEEERRARIFELSADGKSERVFASGIRNPVGIAVHPETGELWASVNERDELGDHLVPDYITSVRDGGFYGWPWFYIGPHQDPRHAGKRPELKDKVIVPDVLLQSHSASLGMVFYPGAAAAPAAAASFPAAYHGGVFAAEHGSWNRERRTGYKVIFVPLQNGKAVGEYVDFLTGFVTAEGNVWGRPVAVAVAKDGALLVTDDAGNCIWRVSSGG